LAVELAFYVLMALLMATKAINYPISVSLLWLAFSNILSILKNYNPTQYEANKIWVQLIMYGPFFIAGMMFHNFRLAAEQKSKITTGVIVLCVATEFHSNGLFMGVTATLIFLIMGLAINEKLKFLVWPFTLWLGGISFTLYLVHRNLGYLILFELYDFGVNGWVALVVVLCTAFLLASGLSRWVEKPGLRWLRSRIK